MAEAAYCAYCFEVLSASLDRRHTLSLHQVESSWDKYASLADRLDADIVHSDDEDQVDDHDGHMNEHDDEDGVGEFHSERDDVSASSYNARRTAATTRSAVVSLSSISLPASQRSASTPSSASATSLQTEASSNTSLTSATSGSSSRPSFFSFGKRFHKGSEKVPPRGNNAVDEFPLFVTWNTISRSGNRSLRGCIGTFESQKIEDGLRSYALTSYETWSPHEFCLLLITLQRF